MTVKILLDTDPGVGIPGTDADDPIAILLALAHPEVELVGITTTFGNCPPALSARGAAAVLRAAGRSDIPVVAGSLLPLSGELSPILVEAYRGDRGRPGSIPLPEAPAQTRSAAEFIVDTVRAAPGEITLVTIGPQTNLAQALQLDPGIAAQMKSIVMMGGALGLDPTYGRGNITSVAECNIYFDPQAADIVFRSGAELTMVSLDVTNPDKGIILAEDDLTRIDGTSALGSFFHEVCATYFAHPMFDWGHGAVLYDPLAVLAAAEPGCGTFTDLAVAVETTGTYTSGQTVPLRDAMPNVHVMTDVDGAAAVARMVDLIGQYVAASG